MSCFEVTGTLISANNVILWMLMSKIATTVEILLASMPYCVADTMFFGYFEMFKLLLEFLYCTANFKKEHFVPVCIFWLGAGMYSH